MRQELYDMMNWWLDKGVSGFRMDAITFIKKDLSFPPMPSDGEDGRCDVGKCCLNRPGIDEFLHELKLNTYGRGDFVTVAETPGVPSKDLNKYIGRDGHFSMIFDFSYTDIDINPGDLWLHQRDWTIEEFKDKLFTNQRLVKKIGWAANYLENHDQPRSIGKYFPAGDIPEYRTQMAKALGALFFFLKGTPFVYQGQELGMINTHFDNIDELDDINSKGQFARCLEAGYSETEAMESVNIRSRDQSRLPMQWNSEKNFGFSAHEPWLACNNQCDLQTVELESVDKDSVLNFYKAMIQLRNHSEYTQTLIYGDLEDVETDNAGIIVYRRKPVQIECACGTGANAESTDRSVYVVVNMTGEDVGYAIPETADVLMGNYADYDGTLRPYETVVYAV
jgi:alpha-glucosidase